MTEEKEKMDENSSLEAMRDLRDLLEKTDNTKNREGGTE